MQATLEKSDDCRVIKIPERFFRDAGFPDNEPVELSLDNRRIVISKNGNRPMTLKERLIEFYGEDYEKHCLPQKEYDWGPPVGNEIW